jgi:hypothetical protein
MQSDQHQHRHEESPDKNGGRPPKYPFRDFLSARPKTAYLMMLAAMAVSAILAFTVMRREGNRQERESMLRKGTEMVGGTLEGLVSSATKLREMLVLRSELEGLLAKDSLTVSDSLALMDILDRLEKLDSLGYRQPSGIIPSSGTSTPLSADTSKNPKSP